MKIWIVVLLCVIGTLVGSIVMLLIGMNLFGNFFVDATFLGGRGYEAGGNLGFLLGLVLGISASVYIIRTMILKQKHASNE